MEVIKHGNQKRNTTGGFYPVLPEEMNKEPAPELRFEPGRFRRHDLTGVSQLHQFSDGGRIERKRNLALSAVHQPLQLFQTTYASDELDTLVVAGVSDSQDRIQEVILQDGN